MKPGIVLLMFGLVLAGVGLVVQQYGVDLKMSLIDMLGREEGNTAVMAGISVIIIGCGIALAGLVTMVVQRRPQP